MQLHAKPCNSMQHNAISCNTMQYHAIPCNTMQYNAIPGNTMQYHASLITADGAYLCPVGSIMAIFIFLGQLNLWPCQSLVHSMSNWLTIGWLDFGPIKIYSMINCDLFCMLVSGTRCLKSAFFLPKNRCLFVNFVFTNVCLPCLKSIGLVYFLL